MSNLNDSIIRLQSQLDILTSETKNSLTNLNERLPTVYANYMGVKGQLGITFTNINSTRDQINSLIILPEYRSDINSVNNLITRLFNRSLTFDEANSAAYNHIRKGI
jgi:hypothetical protein